MGFENMSKMEFRQNGSLVVTDTTGEISTYVKLDDISNEVSDICANLENVIQGCIDRLKADHVTPQVELGMKIALNTIKANSEGYIKDLVDKYSSI